MGLRPGLILEILEPRWVALGGLELGVCGVWGRRQGLCAIAEPWNRVLACSAKTRAGLGSKFMRGQWGWVPKKGLLEEGDLELTF